MEGIPWGPIRSTLFSNFSFGDIKDIIGFSGIDMTQLAGIEQKAKGGASKSQLLSAIDHQIGRMSLNEAAKVASICCEEMLRRNESLIGDIDRVLRRVGWQFYEKQLIPIEIFDVSEINELPLESRQDLLKSATRLRDGDLGGALSSACAALDSTTTSIYLKFNIGDPREASFQEKIKKSLDALRITDKLDQELAALNWNPETINIFCQNLKGAFNQASYIMQQLRSNMGDVHGTKPVVAALVYDSLKWSALLLRILNS
jgi:hypothetical protein